jgi:hypothetical protein
MLHISVAGATGSKFTTSGAINSGVPNRTFKSPVGLYFLASPKSIIDKDVNEGCVDIGGILGHYCLSLGIVCQFISWSLLFKLGHCLSVHFQALCIPLYL